MFKKEIIKILTRIIISILLCLFVFTVNFPIQIFIQKLNNPFISNIWSVNSISFATLMIISILIMLILSKGQISDFGFKIIRNIQIKRISILGFGIGAVFALVGFILPIEANPASAYFSFLQTVIFVWIYASISEEVLVRGLLQSYLTPLIKYGFVVFELRVSLPVLVSAIVFALLHMGLLSMGMNIYSVLYIVLFAFLIGIIAAYYREKTGSLIPAIVVHILANVGGTCIVYISKLL